MKKFIFAGKFDGDEQKLPHREHPLGAVLFKEPDLKKFAVISNAGCVCLTLFLCGVAILCGREYLYENRYFLALSFVAVMITLIPHEFLHGVCFRETVYMYFHLEKGMLFVVGTEDMSKLRFILMSLCPNLVLGLIPFLIGIIFPKLFVVSVIGGMCIGMGFGDYINVFHAITQMPKGAKTYLSGFHSYWYLNSKNGGGQG